MPTLPELIAKMQIRQRDLYPGEDEYFRKNPYVTGMAAEDNQVILNPYSGLTPEQQQAVYNNESLRIGMRQVPITPIFQVTPEQQQYFQGTAYEQNIPEMKNTIIARYLTGDQSAQNVTPQQQEYAKWLMDYLFNNYQSEY